MSYYNTTNLGGGDLADSRSTAKKQDEIVLECFADFPSGATPSDIHKRVLADAPLTSVRRSITTLTSRGLLTKTIGKRRGIFGKPEHVWILPSNPATIQPELF